jgi:aryl-alcohol dehydrogenase-like predicted oxidoreductase
MMQYGEIPGVNKPISRLVQGTSITGFSDPEMSFPLLDAVFDMGCNTIETAHHYGQGQAERMLGRWLSERGVREEIVIITKGAIHNDDRRRVTPFDITSDLFDSLARLNTDYVDLYMLHRDDPDVSVGPIVEVLNEHREAGRIHAFGGSNWTHQRIEQANAYAKKKGLTPFAASSPNYSLAEQFKEPWDNCITISGSSGHAAREWYIENQMPLLAWSSLAGGFFSGRFTRDNLDTFDDYYDQLVIPAYCYEENFKRLDRVALLAEEKGLTIPQVALAYVLRQPLNIFAVVGCKTGAEFKANLEASQVELGDSELAWLNLQRDIR